MLLLHIKAYLAGQILKLDWKIFNGHYFKPSHACECKLPWGTPLVFWGLFLKNGLGKFTLCCLDLLCVGLPELEKVVVMPFCMDKEDIDISSIPNRLDLEWMCTCVQTHMCRHTLYTAVIPYHTVVCSYLISSSYIPMLSYSLNSYHSTIHCSSCSLQAPPVPPNVWCTLQGWVSAYHTTTSYVTGLWQRILYTNPIFELQGYVTQLVFELHLWNLVAGCSYHCTYLTENFSIIACLQMKLRLFKVAKLDECIWPLLEIQSHMELRYMC